MQPPERLVDVLDHAEFVRAEIDGPEGHYYIELTAHPSGFCTSERFGLTVRRDLAAEHESFDLDPVPPAVQRACAALPELERSLVRQMAVAKALADAEAMLAAGPDGLPTTETPKDDPGVRDAERVVATWRWRPFHLVVFGWFIAIVLAVRGWVRRVGVRDGLLGVGVAILGWAFRRGPDTAILGGDAAYERLLSSLGRGSADRYYGETWPSLLGLFSAAEGMFGTRSPGATIEWAHATNRVASVLAVVLVFAVTRRIGLPRWSALLAAICLAVAPVACVMARAEDHAALVAALQLGVLFAASGTSGADAAVAILSAILLGHLRPEQLPVAALCLLPLVWRGQWRWLAPGALGLAARLVYLPPPAGSVPIQWARLLDAGAWPEMLARHLGPLGPLPGWLLFALVPFGALGLRRLRAEPILLLFASLLLYLPKSQPLADPLRLSLPTLSWLAVVGAAGLFWLWTRIRKVQHRWLRRAGVFTVATAGCALVLPLHPSRAPWSWEAEYAFITEQLPLRGAAVRTEAGLAPVFDVLDETPPASPVGWYDNAQDPNGAYAAWFALRSGVFWHAWGEGTPQPGDLVYRGFADRSAGRWLGERCGLDVLAETTVPARTDGWIELGEDKLRLAFYRVRECAR